MNAKKLRRAEELVAETHLAILHHPQGQMGPAAMIGGYLSAIMALLEEAAKELQKIA
jgi:hypothetical protein